MATKPHKDLNQSAYSIVQKATGERVQETAKVDGRKVGGLARAKKQTPEERIDLARRAALARWKKSK